MSDNLPVFIRVFQVFEDITVLYKGSEMGAVLNMKPMHRVLICM